MVEVSDKTCKSKLQRKRENTVKKRRERDENDKHDMDI